MSTGSHAFPKQPQSPDVLGELLHSLSQPLTSLRCSLELSLDLSPDAAAERRQESVSAALQQTEKVIGMIQLMREYLDAEQPGPGSFSAALAPALKNVVEELSTIAAVSGVRLCLVGTCSASLPLPEARLRLALQYLITSIVEAQPDGGKVMLLLGEGPVGTVLRVEGERDLSRGNMLTTSAPSDAGSMLRRVRLAIAGRVLETAGASLAVASGSGDPVGFVLRIPVTSLGAETHLP
jgi:signal transduction histidine kinase